MHSLKILIRISQVYFELKQKTYRCEQFFLKVPFIKSKTMSRISELAWFVPRQKLNPTSIHCPKTSKRINCYIKGNIILHIKTCRKDFISKVMPISRIASLALGIEGGTIPSEI